MLKKIILLVFAVFNLFLLDVLVYASGCTYDEDGTLSSFLNDCKPDTLVGNGVGGNMQVENGLKDKINDFIENLALVIGVGAVGALVYAGMLFQFSGGEDEKVKKAKDIIKWTIVGFLGLISASGIIYFVINVMFGLGQG